MISFSPSVINYIGAGYTSQTPIDFDWYNPHPYQRNTGITKTPKTPVFLQDTKNILELSMDA